VLPGLLYSVRKVTDRKRIKPSLDGKFFIVAEDGVEAFTGDDHVAGLKYMKQNYGARVEKVSDILKRISSAND
jgi:isochorismate hydrolase